MKKSPVHLLVTVMAAVAATTGTVTVGAPPAVAAPSGVYLGQNTTLYPTFSSCSGTRQSQGGAVQSANWSCDRSTGQALAQSFLEGAFASASSSAWMTHEFSVDRHCQLQTGPLTGTITANVYYRGIVYQPLLGDAGASIKYDLNGPGGAAFATFESTGTYSATTSRQLAFQANIGDRPKPTVTVETHAEVTWQPDVVYADFADYGNGRYVRVNNYHVQWNDPTAPTTSHSVSAAQTFNGWYRSPATVSISSRDTESCTQSITAYVDGAGSTAGVDYYESPRQLPVSGTGVKSVSYSAANYNGDVSGTTGFSVKVDGTAPFTSSSVSCSRDSQGNCEKSATVYFSCSDGHSGCGTTTYRVDNGPWQTGSSATIASYGDHTVSYYSTDRVGNVEAVRTTYVRVVCDLYDVLGICLL